MASRTFHLAAEHNGLTLAAALKRLLDDHSWSHVRKLIAGRQIQVNGNLSLDAERKIGTGDVVKLFEQSLAPPATAEDVRLAYIDEHLLVIEKPAGVTTLRHREETDLPQRRKQLQPTLDELIQRRLAQHFGEDEHAWGLTGMFHDLDQDTTAGDAERHAYLAADWLREAGVDEKVVNAVLA